MKEIENNFLQEETFEPAESDFGLYSLEGMPKARMSTFASNEEGDKPKRPIDPRQNLELPTAYRATENETVSMGSGTLDYSVTDFVLPGRDGFDLNITRRYSSYDAATITNISLNNEKTGNVAGGKNNDHNLQTHGLGYGWSFALPSIECIPGSWQSQKHLVYSYRPTLHLADGRSFSIVDNSNGLSLENYTLHDVVLEKSDGVFTAYGESRAFNTILKLKGGYIAYFNRSWFDGEWEDAQLVGQQDRFGNKMLIERHGKDGMRIVDTWGRTIKLERQGNNLVWTLPDGNIITYEREFMGEDAYKLTAVQNQLGHKTQYTYHRCEALAQENIWSEAGNLMVPFELLSQIQYPSGATTHYHYGFNAEDVPVKFGKNEFGGYTVYFPLLKRYETGRADYQMIPMENYNLAEYSYTVGSPEEKIPLGRYLSRAEVHFANTGVREVHTFNKESQLTEKQVLANGVLKSKHSYTYGTELIQNDYRVVKTQKDITYENGQAFEKETLYDYGEQAGGGVARQCNVRTLTENYPSDASLNRVTEMDYGDFSVLTRKSILKNREPKVCLTEVYQQEEKGSGRVVAKILLDDKTEVERTEYSYVGGSSQVREEKQFYLQKAGPLYDYSDYKSIFYTYDEGKRVTAPVKTEIAGVLDFDGAPLPNITESFDYDVFGRVTAKTDPLGRTTHFEYDALGRVTAQTNPDGTQKTTQYADTGIPMVLSRDENGNCTCRRYTTLGQLNCVSDATTLNAADWGTAVFASYLYDKQGQLSRETVYEKLPGGKSSTRSVTRYRYDAFGRVTLKEIGEEKYRKQGVVNTATGEITYVEMPYFERLNGEAYEYLDVCKNPANGRISTMVRKISGDGGRTGPDIVNESYADQLEHVEAEYLAGQRTSQTGYNMLGHKIWQTDAKGNRTEWEVDYAGRQLKTTQWANGQKQTSETRYNALGLKSMVTDFKGTSTSYDYDVAGRLLQQTGYMEAERKTETRTHYDAAGQVVLQRQLVEEGNWKSTEYQYDACGRQVEVRQYLTTDWRQWNATRTGYDGMGNKLATTTGLTQSEHTGQTTRASYNRFGKVVTSTDALGQTENCEYSLTGALLRKTDRNGRITSYSYNPLGQLRLEKVENSPKNNNFKQSSYHFTGKKTAEIVGRMDGSGRHEDFNIYYAYNNKGQLTRQLETPDVVKEYSYDANGNRTGFTLTKHKTRDLARVLSSKEYDKLNLWNWDYGWYGLSSNEYDLDSKARLRPWLANNQAPVACDFDVTKPNMVQYDAMGCSARGYHEAGDDKLRPWVKGNNKALLAKEYDELAPTQTELASYGLNARQYHETSGRKMAPWLKPFTAPSAEYYDGLDMDAGEYSGYQLTGKQYHQEGKNRLTDPCGAPSGWLYDGMELSADGYATKALTGLQHHREGRERLLAPLHAPQAAEYDGLLLSGDGFETASLTGLQYHQEGRERLGVKGLAAPAPFAAPITAEAEVAQTNCQSKVPQPTAEAESTTGEIATTAAPQITRSAAPRAVETEVIPQLYIQLRYEYDTLNRLTQVWRGELLLAEYSYDANGNRTRLTHPQNGLETHYTYNMANLVTTLENWCGGKRLSRFAYTYSLDGSQTSKTVQYSEGNSTAGLIQGRPYTALSYRVGYTYDKLGRLVREADEEWQTIDYTYDDNHNRKTMKVVGKGVGDESYTVDYSYDANNRLLYETKTPADGSKKPQMTVYRYDAAGNQTQKAVYENDAGSGKTLEPTETREYNSLNQLEVVRRGDTTATYGYRSDGLRAQKMVDITRGNTATRTITHHEWDGQNLVMDLTGGGDVKAVYLRGASLIAQQIAGQLYYYTFNAHGDVVQRVGQTGAAGPKYKYDAFGNQRGTSETDPNPFRYCGEYYDAESGTVYLRNRNYDTATGRFSSEDPIQNGLNWYTYCGNEPVRHNDPLGLISADIWRGEVDKNGNQKGSPNYRKGPGSAWAIQQTSKAKANQLNQMRSAQRALIEAIENDTSDRLTLAMQYLAVNSFVLSAVSNQMVPFNEENFSMNSLYTFNDFIYDQTAGNAAKLKMGYKDGAYGGCGWVASYNAFRLLGRNVHPANIIAGFEERGGIILNGTLGTNPLAIANMFDKTGFSTQMYNSPIAVDQRIAESKVSILTYMHDSGAHFIAVQEVEGVFYGYNVYSGETTVHQFVSIDEWINKYNFKPISLITMN